MKRFRLMSAMPVPAILLLPAEEGLALAAVAIGAAGLVVANLSLLVLPEALLRHVSGWLERMATVALAAVLVGVAILLFI